MAQILYGPQQTVLNFTDNEALAQIQAVVHARFMTGVGFFMTLAGRIEGGDETTTAYWMHPSIPLLFHYDVRDAEDNYAEIVVVDDEAVSRSLSYLDKPLGFIGGFSKDGPYLPFAPPSEPAETAMPVAGANDPDDFGDPDDFDPMTAKF